MPHVTVTLPGVRLRLSQTRTTAFLLSSIVIFLVVVVSYSRAPDDWLHYEWVRYVRPIDLLGSWIRWPVPIKALAVLLLRSVLTAIWLSVVLGLLGSPTPGDRVVARVMGSEFVYLLPSTIHTVWNRYFQGDLNQLPDEAFEPLFFGDWWFLKVSAFNTYWLMYVLILSTCVPANRDGSFVKKRMWVFLAFALATVVAEMTIFR